jgi:DNA-binding transcriptional regulator YiaG
MTVHEMPATGIAWDAVERQLAVARARRRLPEPRLRRSIRKDAGLTLASVADALGVTLTTVARWERGERTPRGSLLIAYAELLDFIQERAP